MKGLALGLALKQSRKATQKSPIGEYTFAANQINQGTLQLRLKRLIGIKLPYFYFFTNSPNSTKE